MVEIERKVFRKRIEFPNGDEVFIPVVQRVPFRVAAEQAQDRVMYFRNNAGSNRVVHVRNLPPADEPEETDPDKCLRVERIDKINVRIAAEQAQDVRWLIKNLDPPPIQPDGTNDPHHERVHYVRFFPDNDSDSESWVDVELIDQLKVIEPHSQYQEWWVYVRHDELGEVIEDPEVDYGPVTVGFCDPELPIAEAVAGDEELDPPYRLDPFQNIINWQGGGVYLLFLFSWHDFLTGPLGERCTLTQNIAVPGPLANTFTAGVQTRVASAEAVDIVCNGDAMDSLLNGVTDSAGQPELVTTETFAQGYAKFPPCFDCATNIGPVIWDPPGDISAGGGGAPPGFDYCSPEYDGPNIYADPIPYNQYERSFLFDIPASEPDEDNPTAGNTATTKIEFEIFGLPGPRLSQWVERILPTFPGGPGTTRSFNEINQNTVCQFTFSVWVFSKSAVDLYLTDKVFPLRKKGIDPTAPTAVDQTKAIYRTRVILLGTVNQGWIDEGGLLHECLSDADFNTGEMGTFAGTFEGEAGTGSETVNLNFHFENFDVGPGNLNPSIVTRQVAWPVEPDGQIVNGLISGDTAGNVTPIFGPLHNREYFWFYTINGAQNVMTSEVVKDFGQPPLPPPTA